MKELKSIFGFIAILVAIGLFIYGTYWFYKTGSYFFFYEDMVQETIREMVKPEHLNNP